MVSLEIGNCISGLKSSVSFTTVSGNPLAIIIVGVRISVSLLWIP